MAQDRRQRLAHLADLQRRLKALHETRQALHRKDAAAAEREAEDLATRFDTPGSISTLFPELYQERIARAFARREQSLKEAENEAEKTAMADARANVAERTHRVAARRCERAAEEKAVLEMLELRLKPAK